MYFSKIYYLTLKNYFFHTCIMIISEVQYKRRFHWTQQLVKCLPSLKLLKLDKLANKLVTSLHSDFASFNSFRLGKLLQVCDKPFWSWVHVFLIYLYCKLLGLTTTLLYACTVNPYWVHALNTGRPKTKEVSIKLIFRFQKRAKK